MPLRFVPTILEVRRQVWLGSIRPVAAFACIRAVSNEYDRKCRLSNTRETCDVARLIGQLDVVYVPSRIELPCSLGPSPPAKSVSLAYQRLVIPLTIAFAEANCGRSPRVCTLGQHDLISSFHVTLEKPTVQIRQVEAPLAAVCWPSRAFRKTFIRLPATSATGIIAATAIITPPIPRLQAAQDPCGRFGVADQGGTWL